LNVLFWLQSNFPLHLGLGKQTPTLTSRKISNSPCKQNTPTQTLHGLGFCIARRSLLSFPHFSPKRMDSTPIDPPRILPCYHNLFGYRWKKLKNCVQLLNFPKKMQASSFSFKYDKLKNFFIHKLHWTYDLKNLKPYLNLWPAPCKKAIKAQQV
jgi:hypothetical protein